jgi:NAD(P)-dependent dehydrogenase (short-subunit alcohol dehydrogenase family)
MMAVCDKGETRKTKGETRNFTVKFFAFRLPFFPEVSMRLTNKVAIITGAGTGFGEAAALLFAKEGAKVVAVGRRKDLVEKVVARIRTCRGKAIALQADVSKLDDCERVVAETLRAFKKIAVLFNNAGVHPSRTSVTDTTLEAWDETIAVNLKGVFLMMKAVIPVMIRNGGGSIINTSSTAGVRGVRDRAPYCASKGGVSILTKNVALDYAKYAIRCNAICPGPVETGMTHQYYVNMRKNPKKWKRFIAQVPLRRLGEAKDVAYAALYLASDEAKWVTGIDLIVDGGLVAG